MRWLIDFSVRRPVAIAMTYCALALLAWASWTNLPVDVVPEGEFPELIVNTSWAGASPESIQSLITSPVETVAVTIPGVHKVLSQSRRGGSAVTVQFLEDADLDLARFELADRLSLLQDDLPPAVQAPQISTILPSQFQELAGGEFFSFTLRAPRSINELRVVAKEEVRDALISVAGVADVNVTGGQDPHLRVTLDPEALELYGLTAWQVAGAVREVEGEWPVGQIDVGGTAFTLRIDQKLENLDPLRRLPLQLYGDRLVLLDDVADVQFGYAEVEQFSRVDGEPLISVRVGRKPGTDVLGVARAVRAELAALQTTLPADITFEVVTDEAADLEQELDLVSRRLMVVLILVAALLIILLRDLRSAPLLFTSIGAALAITITALYHLEIPVNVLTLTGLALAFGMLVDNAVVVLENIMRHRENGEDSQTAARRGTSEVIVPVLAATLTTVGVFFPFVYFQGRMRDYFTPMALAITFALGASLIVALTLTPAAAGRGWVAKRVRAGSTRLPWFRSGLGLGLRHPYIVVLLAVGALYGSYHLFNENVARGSFFGFWGNREQITVNVTLQSGAEATRTEQAMRPFEEYVLGLPDIERVELIVNNNRGTMQVKFPAEMEVTQYPLVVKDEIITIASRYAGLRVSVFGFDQNGYSSGFSGSSWMSSRIKLYGYNYEQLGLIGEEVARIARRSARVRDSQVTAGGFGFWRDEGGELVMRVRRDMLAQHGLTVTDLRAQLESLLSGRTTADRLRVGADEWDTAIKVAGVERRALNDVLRAPLRGDNSGTRIGDFVTVGIQSVPGVITREDQRYDRYVQWDYRGSGRAAEAYRKAIFESLELPPGYSASLEDDRAFTDEERAQTQQVATLALIIIFMVLASLYESLWQPFIVLLSVPAAMIGVFLIYYLTEEPFDAAASIGVVLLGGIVVNNAILLVDHINLRRKEMPLVEAIVAGTAERVRPILITSITTIGGMLPLVLIEAEVEMRSNDIWGTLALSTIGGLTASTLLTLTLTPVLFLLAERWRARAQNFGRRVVGIWRSLPA
ncbi:MAG: MMPL family transporter [Acidobacteria bacterium]|nr:MMPL family transporter [Acidobacteriota bacterium]